VVTSEADRDDREPSSAASAGIDARTQSPIVLYVDVYPYRIEASTGRPLFLALKRRTDVELADSWQPISGKIRAGEPISAAFRRLLRSKTGQRPVRLWSLDQLNMFYDGHYDAVMIVPAAAAELADASVFFQGEVHTEFAWLTGDEARSRFSWPIQHACVDEVERALAAGLSNGRYKFRQLSVSD
jgi:dATP pyrophosphohydrolase